MKKSSLTIATLTAATITATAEPIGVPRGIDVLPQAGNCNIGPFEQVTKAVPYNALCDTMPDAEKCLALIKRHMNAQYTLDAVRNHNVDRVQYCLEHIRTQLFPPEAEGQ